MKRRHYDYNIQSDKEYQENRESLIQEQNFKKDFDKNLIQLKIILKK